MIVWVLEPKRDNPEYQKSTQRLLTIPHIYFVYDACLKKSELFFKDVKRLNQVSGIPEGISGK